MAFEWTKNTFHPTQWRCRFARIPVLFFGIFVRFRILIASELFSDQLPAVFSIHFPNTCEEQVCFRLTTGLDGGCAFIAANSSDRLFNNPVRDWPSM